MLTNVNGEYTNLAWTTEGDVEVDGFCSLIYNGEFYIFGFWFEIINC